MVTKTYLHIKSYIELCIWLLVFAIGIRFFEAILLYNISHKFISNILWNLTGLCYDISLFLRLSACILPIFVIVSFISEKVTRTTLRVLLSLILFFSIVCIIFFSTSGFLLDNAVFAYSIKDTIGIIKASTKSPVWVYIVAVVLPVLFFYFSGKRIKIHRVLIVTFLILVLSSFFVLNNLSLHTNQYHIKANKEFFFLKSVLQKRVSAFEENNEQLVHAVHEFRSYFPELQFVEPEFPFLYQAVYKDVLSPFFDLKPEPPNFVIIIIESLAYDFLRYGNVIMPFLDSLSKKSLSWDQCLSVSARTYGVFPALFGTAPLGKYGFMDLCPNNPAYHSLPSILSQNGYTNTFFYGGWMGFDNMAQFSKKNDITYLKDRDWEEEIVKNNIGAAWGYEDHITYKQAHRILNKITTSPRMDVYLSHSTHDPFEYPESSYFQNIIKNKTIQSNDLSEKEKKNILSSLKLNGSFAYSDWSIQQLMEEYKKRDDYENTIFIITGDHDVRTNQFRGYANYHVPLIIYSPMLKSGRNMKGVVSHRDITPTILSLLKNNYDIKTPNEVTWLNTALDTSLIFNATSFSPLQVIGHTIGGVLYNNYLFCEGILEELTDKGPQKIDKPEVLKQMERLQYLYQSLDLYILNNDALIRNFYAHKNKSAKTAIDIEDTIAAKSYFASSSKLPVLEGPDGHNTTLYFDDSSEYPIGFLNYEIPIGIEIFKVDIAFKIYAVNEGDKHIELVADLLGTPHYKVDYLKVDIHNSWYTYENSFIFRKEIWEQAENEPRLKIFLWNHNQLKGYIDDIKVKVVVN